MGRHSMEDGTIVDTDKAVVSYEEERDFDGHNHIGRSSGSQWHWVTLYRSQKGRYYVVTVGGHQESASFVTPEEAARFLLLNEHELPEDLKQFETAIVE